MKYFIFLLSVALVSNSGLVSSNSILRNQVKKFVKDHINELKSIEAVKNLFGQRPWNGNDDPTVNIVLK